GSGLAALPKNSQPAPAAITSPTTAAPAIHRDFETESGVAITGLVTVRPQRSWRSTSTPLQAGSCSRTMHESEIFSDLYKSIGDQPCANRLPSCVDGC